MKGVNVMGSTAGADLRAILAASADWRVVARGPVGELWSGPRDTEVGFPYALTPAAPEWHGVIERIAYGLRTSTAALTERVQHFRFDVTDFRAAGASWDHSVPVEAGVDLVTTARTMLRTSATTARNAKAVIGGNYSAPGDRVVADARFGQTREGSYIIPLLVPVATESAGTAEAQPELETPLGERVLRNAAIESDARRTTRTMAQSLSAIWTQIVEPERVPSERLVGDLVTAGISREMVRSLSEVLGHPSVNEFDATFHWSEHPSVPAPSGLTRVALPGAAASLLDEVATRFRETNSVASEALSGQIVELRDEAAGIGAITLSTVRNSRNVEVLVPLRGETLEAAHTWFADREVVLVRGIVRPRGGRLRMETPESVGPVGQVAFDY